MIFLEQVGWLLALGRPLPPKFGEGLLLLVQRDESGENPCCFGGKNDNSNKDKGEIDLLFKVSMISESSGRLSGSSSQQAIAI